MKKFLKLVFFCVVTYLVYNYLDNHHISVSEKISGAGAWLHNKYDAITKSSQGDKKTTYVEPQKINKPDYQSSHTEKVNVNQNQNTTDNLPGEDSINVTANDVAPQEIDNSNNTSETVQPVEMPAEPENFPHGNQEWVKAVTEKYSPDTWFMLMEYDKLPPVGEAPSSNGSAISSPKPSQTFSFLQGSSKETLLANMATNVHENAHAYYRQNVYRYARENNIQYDWDKVYGYIYITPSESFFVSFPRKSLFPSNKLVSVIPGNLRTFRFDDYIDGITSTQEEGVFGLLNELHAYYLGSKLNYDVLPGYILIKGSEADGLFDWVMHCQSEMTAFYEFDFFIREYLLYMKHNYASDYEALKAYKPFGEAYAAVRTVYQQLVYSYIELIKSEIQKINESGKEKFSIENGYLAVKYTDGTGSRVPVFSDDRTTLLPVIGSGRYNEILNDFPGI